MIDEKGLGKPKTNKVIEALNRDQRVRSGKRGNDDESLGGGGLSSGALSSTSPVSQRCSCNLLSNEPTQSTFLSGMLRGNEDMGLDSLFEDDRSVVRSPFHSTESSVEGPASSPLQRRSSSTRVFLSGIAVIAPDKVTDMETIMNLR